MFVAQEFLH